ncbi:MAG: hypothetical protein M1817_006728 [Caeruleum heppii]|nr:MAG: hypothetical protein M1817_006728 [Caeruleum heppii]
MAPSTSLAGVVINAGLMMKTVKVRIMQQVWNKHIRKHFPSPTNILVHDPASSLRTGDVIRLRSGFRSSKHVHHVVEGIVAPFGTGVEDRPPVVGVEELERRREVRRVAKRGRREERRGRKDEGVGVAETESRETRREM